MEYQPILVDLYDLLTWFLSYVFVGAMVAIMFAASMMDDNRRLSAYDRTSLFTIPLSWPVFLLLAWLNRNKKRPSASKFPHEPNKPWATSPEDKERLMKIGTEMGFRRMGTTPEAELPKKQIQDAPIFPGNAEGKKPNVVVLDLQKKADERTIEGSEKLSKHGVPPIYGTDQTHRVQPPRPPETGPTVEGVELPPPPVPTEKEVEHRKKKTKEWAGEEGEPGEAGANEPPQVPMAWQLVIPPETYSDKEFPIALLLLTFSILNNDEIMEPLKSEFTTFELAIKEYDTPNERGFWISGVKVNEALKDLPKGVHYKVEPVFDNGKYKSINPIKQEVNG